MLVLDMIEILPPLGKYKYDTWRILPMKCYIDNFVRLQSYIRNVNRDLRPYLVTKILKHAAIEVLSIVDCDLLQNSVTADDVLPEKILYSCQGHVSDGLRFNPLGELFHCYHDKSVVSLYGREFANNIDAPPLQWPRWGDQLRRLGQRF
jgi:hypothetical protein